jgi:hypothetical protein
MMHPRAIRALFGVAAAYDGVLGLLFLLAPTWPFELFDIAPPNHLGYVRFPAALLLIFGVMFFQIAQNPTRFRDLIIYGILLKIAYCGVTFGYWLTEGVPVIWKPFAVIDLIMGLLFIWAYRDLGPRSAAPQAGP